MRRNYHANTNDPFRVLTVNVGRKIIEQIDLLAKKGYVASRSEFIRIAINHELMNLRKTFEDLHELILGLPDRREERQMMPPETRRVNLEQLPEAVRKVLAERRIEKEKEEPNK